MALDRWAAIYRLLGHAQYELGKNGPRRKKRRKVEAKLHVDFCAQLYRIQHEQGRLFLHEHPDRATSWNEPSIQAIAKIKDILFVRADQCEYGLMVKE